MKHFGAPWSRSLVVMSSVLTLVVAGVSALQAYLLDGIMRWNGVLLLALVFCCALFTVRGYTITDDELLVHRLLWSTRVPLSGLQSAAFEPDAMRGSIRTFGNGGLFSITGRFRSKSLAAYRAFVTDQQRTVVLRFAERTVVVSPAAPEEFVRELAAFTQVA
jgi:hypothetical protein